MQKKLWKLRELNNKIINLIVEENFSALPKVIEVIKKITFQIEDNLKNYNFANLTNSAWDKSLQNPKYLLLKEQIKKLEERVSVIEKTRNPSMQIKHTQSSNNNKNLWE